MKLKILLIQLGIGTVFLTTSSNTIACDSCAQAAIDSGFQTMKAAADTNNSSVDTLNDTIGKLKDAIEDAGDSNSDAVTDLGDSLSDTLSQNSTSLVAALNGVAIQIDAVFKKLTKAEETQYLEVKNSITNDIKSYSQLVRMRESVYEAGGELGSFLTGEKADALINLYTVNTGYSKSIYDLNADFIKRWNAKDDELTPIGVTEAFVEQVRDITDQGDELINAINTQQIITSDEYKDAVYYTAFGYNPTQVETDDDDFLSIAAQQAHFLRNIVFKAPIIPLSDENIVFLDDVTPLYFEAGNCPQTLIDKGILASDVGCTSLDAIMSVLVARPGMSTYSVAAAVSSKRGLLEELNRSLIIGNIIEKRKLDTLRSSTILEAL